MIDLGDVVAVDIETTGLEWQDRVLSISMAKYDESGEPEVGFINMGYWQEANLFGLMGASDDAADVAIVPETPPSAREAFLGFVGNKRWLVFHNGSFDIPYLVRLGVITEDELYNHYHVFDTMVMARAIGPHDAVSLFALCQEEGIGVGDERWLAAKGKRAHLEDLPYDEFRYYSEVDALYTLELVATMLHAVFQIYPDGQLVDEESEWVKIVAMMRYYGLRVNREALVTRKGELNEEIQRLRHDLQPTGIKSGSDKTGIVRWAEKAGIASFLRRTAKGNISTDEQSFEGLRAYPSFDGKVAETIERIAALRAAEKAHSTWVVGTEKRLCSAGRVHPSFTASGTISNRLRCSKPAAQAYPKEYRMFVATEGRELWEIDWSQAEIRIAAMFSRSLKFARIFQDPEADPHMDTAIEMFGKDADRSHRRLAKAANFGSLYGAGPKVISQTTGLPEPQSKQLLNDHRRAFPMLSKASKRAQKAWEERGFLKLLGGKRSYASKSDLERSYKAFNALIQGSVAELIKKAMVQIRKECPEATLVSQVHDSVWIEVPAGRRDIVDSAARIMRDAVPAYVRELTDPQIDMAVDAERIG